MSVVLFDKRVDCMADPVRVEHLQRLSFKILSHKGLDFDLLDALRQFPFELRRIESFRHVDGNLRLACGEEQSADSLFSTLQVDRGKVCRGGSAPRALSDSRPPIVFFL